MFNSGVIKCPKLLRFILLLYKFTSTETEGLQLSLFKFYQDGEGSNCSNKFHFTQCKEKRKPPLCLFSKMGTCILRMLQV